MRRYDLLEDLTEKVAILAAPPVDQERFLISNGYGFSELYEQLYDAARVYYEYLEHDRLIDLETEEAVGAVLRGIEALIDTEAWQLSGLHEPAWTAVRRRAAIAAEHLARFNAPEAGDDPNQRT